MGAHCPHCDMYSQNEVTCDHCGQPLPQAVEVSAAGSRRGSVGSATASGGASWIRWIVPAAIVVVLALFAYHWLLAPAGAGPIPAYMNEGPVKLVERVLPGKLNIVDLYSEYCPPCRQIAPWLDKLDHARDDIHVVRININRPDVKGIDWHGPIAKQFRLRFIPHFIIVGPDGQLQSQGKPAYKQVIKLIKESLSP